jgi:ABC-2 type transport system permease protein
MSLDGAGEIWISLIGMLSSTLFYPLGTDLFCLGKKFLVFNLVSRNLKVKYRRSILGVFWTLLAPIATGCVYYFVFSLILKVQIPYYFAFILAGVLPWTFFAQTVVEGMESLVGNLGLLSKIPVPLQVFPYVGAITNLVTLAIGFPVIVGGSYIAGAFVGASIILVPFYIMCLFLITYSFALGFSVLFVYFRDLRHLSGIILQLWFYGTPILYDREMIPERYQWLLAVNPLGYLFDGLHATLIYGRWPSAMAISVTAGWAVGSVAMAAVVRRYLCHELVERL